MTYWHCRFHLYALWTMG